MTVPRSPECRLDRAEQRELLLGLERRRFAGRTADDQPVVAAIDEELRDPDGFVDVDGAVARRRA